MRILHCFHLGHLVTQAPQAESGSLAGERSLRKQQPELLVQGWLLVQLLQPIGLQPAAAEELGAHRDGQPSVAGPLDPGLWFLACRWLLLELIAMALQRLVEQGAEVALASPPPSHWAPLSGFLRPQPWGEWPNGPKWRKFAGSACAEKTMRNRPKTHAVTFLEGEEADHAFRLFGSYQLSYAVWKALTGSDPPWSKTYTFEQQPWRLSSQGGFIDFYASVNLLESVKEN